jgi:hypothetical protein
MEYIQMKKLILAWWYRNRCSHYLHKSIRWNARAERDVNDGEMGLARLAFQLSEFYKGKDKEYQTRLAALKNEPFPKTN